MSKTILSLDLGSSLGWAIVRDSVLMASGTQKFPGGEKIGEALSDFTKRFLIKYVKVDEIFFEDVRFLNNRNHMMSHFGYKCALYTFSYETGIPLTGITPSDWKRVLTGKSHGGEKGMEKYRICKYLHEMGWTGGLYGTDKSNDEADSIAIAAAILKLRGGDLKIRLD